MGCGEGPESSRQMQRPHCFRCNYTWKGLNRSFRPAERLWQPESNRIAGALFSFVRICGRIRNGKIWFFLIEAIFLFRLNFLYLANFLSQIIFKTCFAEIQEK